MADEITVKISELPGAGVLTGIELVPLVQDGVTKTRSIQNIVSEGVLKFHTDASDPHDQYAFRVLNNLSATTDPSANNDSSEGYAVLSRWVNISTAEVWLCVGSEVGNANWQTATLSISDLGSAAVANTGAGNGLDADLLDGKQGTFYLDRSSHTGTQPASTITGLADAATTTVSTIRAGTTKGNVGLSAVDNYSRAHYDGRYLATNAKASDSDNLDGLNSSQFSRVTSRSNARVGPGWVTVAQNTSSRYYGEVYVTDGESGDHSFIRIFWMRSYNDSDFVIKTVGGHSPRITAVRVLRDGNTTYGNKKLQIYVTTSSDYHVAVLSPMNIANYGVHSVVQPVVQNSISGYTEQGKIDGLESASFGTQKEIRVGTNTVWHSGNFDPNDKANTTGTYALRATGTTKSDVGLSNVGNYSRAHFDSRYLAAAAKAVDSNKLDGLDSSQFLRSDANDTKSGTLTFYRANASGDTIKINNTRSSSWPLIIRSDGVGNDNPSGFWLGSNGYPDMRLRKHNSTITALISSWEKSYVSNGFDVTGDLDASGRITSGNGIEVAGSVDHPYNGVRSVTDNNGHLMLDSNGGNLYLNWHDGGDVRIGGASSRIELDADTYLDSGKTIHGDGSGLTGTAPLRATGTTKADVGLSAVRNVDAYSKGESNSRYLTTNGKAADSNKLDGLDSSEFLKSNKDIEVVKSNPWLTLDSSSSGSNGVDQGAGISIGESGKKGSAVLHMTYTGDGISRIGMGSVDASGIPAYTVMRMYYQSKNVNFEGNVTASGNITAYSDKRLKKDLVVIPTATDKVKQLAGYTYTNINNGSRNTGVVAQEVQKVLPEAVHEDDDGMLSVAYGNMVGLLIESIKEQQIQIDELKRRIG